MKFQLLICLLVVAACQDPKPPAAENTERLELIPEPDKNEKPAITSEGKPQKTACDFSDPDTSLNGILLRDDISADAVLGASNARDEQDQYHFYSRDRKELLSGTQFGGDGRNTLSLFAVRYTEKPGKKYKELPIAQFQTEKGIRLGLSKAEITAKLGSCYTLVDSSASCMTIQYRLQAPQDSHTGLLQRQNMPVYYATYRFCKDKLNYFEFGFEYP